MTTKIKATFLLPTDDLDYLRAVAEKDGDSVTTVLRRLIRTDRVLRELTDNGDRLYATRPDGTEVRELVRI